MQIYYVYILKCNDGTYYVGHTDDLEKRVSEHKNRIYRCYTSSKLPVTLVFQQAFVSRDEAFIIERKIKKWSHKKKTALIAGDFKLLSKYAKKNF